MTDASKTILIAGPTASGKSALALAMAERVGGVIINADSMQVYRELRILLGPADAGGRKSAFRTNSMASFRRAKRIRPAVSCAMPRKRLLRHEARAVDPSSSAARVFTSRRCSRACRRSRRSTTLSAIIGGAKPRGAVQRPFIASLRSATRRWRARLAPADTQRVVRALEVLEQTGRSLAEWQMDRTPPVVDEAETVELLLNLDRSELHARADARFERMMAEGALEEAKALSGLGIDPSLPAMRAIGVRPLIAAVERKCSFEEAVGAAKLETRHYVKRQETWFKRQMISWRHINAQHMERNMAEIFAFIQP